MITQRTPKSLVSIIIVTAVMVGTAAPLLAETRFQKNHPRREQVNERLANQNRRINQARKEGELTPQQARKLHREDRQIRQEERDMASQNSGHITRSEQRVLNQQENAVSRQIRQ